MGHTVAVLGATGLVGGTILEILEQRRFPVAELLPLASGRSRGRTVRFGGRDLPVQVAEPGSFTGVDLVLASAGAEVSERLVPAAAAAGAVAIDNTSAFRMAEGVPLVVPEVNPHRLADYPVRRIIANPNCSTIQLAVALKPIHDRVGIRRVLVSTYQSVSGAGRRALAELRRESTGLLLGQACERQVFPRQIAFNALPHIDRFLEDGSTREEWKIAVELPKIMEAAIPVHATAVRVPVFYSHSEAVWIETEDDLSPAEARAILGGAPGVAVLDDGRDQRYPTAAEVAGSDRVYVGRIRRDPTVAHGLALWIVADNLRKGAALNAVQIAEGLVELWRRQGGRSARAADGADLAAVDQMNRTD